MTNEKFTPRVSSVSRSLIKSAAAAGDTMKAEVSPFVRSHLIDLAGRCHARIESLVEQASGPENPRKREKRG